MKRLAIAAALAATSLCSQADPRILHLVLGGGLTYGGEKLATVTYSNGDTQDVRSGGLVDMHVGLDVRATPWTSFQATLGYHTDSSEASNGSVRFTRVPIEVLGYFHPSDSIRLGGGIRLVQNPKLRGRGAANTIADQDFDNATGIVLEGEYLFTSWMGLKLRAVSETYRSRATGIKANGDHGGLFLNFYL
jgi:hypothetical protein